jgi:ribosomal protein S18 acetylase RimI-like enzyme
MAMTLFQLSVARKPVDHANRSLLDMAVVETITVRPGRSSDVDELLAFWRTAAEGKSISDDHDGVTRLLERDPESVLIAELDETIVGTVIAAWDGWRCHLYRLAVAPSNRRQGIATTLLAAADQRFEALGGRRVDAMVLDANERAHQVWKAAGYTPDPKWTRWIKPLTRP